MVETTKYLRKPLYVDAVRVTGGNFDEIAAWCQGEILRDEVVNQGFTGKKYIKVRVHNPKNPRQTKAFVGDWILYTERGYKVYTSKAFHAAFDEVVEGETAGEEGPPLFYIDPGTGWLTDEQPHEGAKALSFEELMDILKHEVTSEARAERREREAALGLVSDKRLTGDPVVDANGGTPSNGAGEIAVVEATPEAIAEAVHVNEAAREREAEFIDHAVPADTVRAIEKDNPSITAGAQALRQAAGVPEKVKAEAVAGKRVLSIQEQSELTPDAIRELVQSGEAVLIQDV